MLILCDNIHMRNGVYKVCLGRCHACSLLHYNDNIMDYKPARYVANTTIRTSKSTRCVGTTVIIWRSRLEVQVYKASSYEVPCIPFSRLYLTIAHDFFFFEDCSSVRYPLRTKKKNSYDPYTIWSSRCKVATVKHDSQSTRSYRFGYFDPFDSTENRVDTQATHHTHARHASAFVFSPRNKRATAFILHLSINIFIPEYYCTISPPLIIHSQDSERRTPREGLRRYQLLDLRIRFPTVSRDITWRW